MDPNANLERQLELSSEMLERDMAHERVTDVGYELAEHVHALHEWITNGGFLPSDWDPPGAAQGRALAHVMATQGAAVERLHPSPFDLPAGYWGVRLTNGFECGIAPDGSVSS